MDEKQMLVISALLLGFFPIIIEGLRRRKSWYVLKNHFWLGVINLICAYAVGALVMEIVLSYGPDASGESISKFIEVLFVITMLLPTGLAAAHFKQWGDRG